MSQKISNEQTPFTLSILILDAFINIWICKTRTEIELLCNDNEILKKDMLKSQLSEPLEAWFKIKERMQIKVENIEDCTILGYSWGQIKQIIEYAKQTNFHPLRITSLD